MHQPASAAIHCINPDCPKPYPQAWGNNFCQSCGASLRLRNRYIPLQRLGVGGFAAIYTAWDLQVQTERVIKVLLDTSGKALELFEQEAWVLGRLQHPGIPRVEPDGYFQVDIRSFASEPGNYARRLPCLVMEKIDGKTLQDILDEYPQGCPEVWVVNWLWQAVEILQELHSYQIIHRDIKPSNLMIRHRTGQLVMIDFGGVKQFGDLRPRGSNGVSPSVTSTRLISPGYSPPEQISGGGVGPAADFYALGRTCIHLLTGKYPAELEDPVTGELRWRSLAPISPGLGNLLDDMVQLDLRQRPASAEEIEERLEQIAAFKQKGGSIATAPGSSAVLNFLWEAVMGVSEGMGHLTISLFSALAQTVVACLDTGWEMLLGGIWGSVGAVTGLILAYGSSAGARFADLLAQLLLFLEPSSASFLLGWTHAVGPELLLFCLAGLGTAIGLTSAGGFRQRRRFWLAGVTGTVGYGLAGLCWSGTLAGGVTDEMVLLGAVATASLSLGMGLRSHPIIHVLVSAIGTATLLATLNTFNWFPYTFFQLLWQSSAGPDWLQFWGCVAFFGLLGGAIAFCLGISHYVVVPVLRWLGWR